MATEVGAVAAAHGPGYHDSKAAHLKRLRRIEGQVRGIARMVEEDQYCIDVLTQVSAATKALQAVALGLLDEHLSHCVVDAVAAGGEERDTKLEEASAAIARLVRS
jgi:CsoR family transcriptional regulator, copper-sensing transcriptional repressor